MISLSDGQLIFESLILAQDDTLTACLQINLKLNIKNIRSY